ncbi:MAG: sugar transferase [Lachnospiraceae bacterium]|nr:sugar transferase [Lachnospiraceae bacterium]
MYRKQSNRFIKHLDFVILDIACLQIAFVLAYVLVRAADEPNPYSIAIYRNMALMIGLVSLVVMFGADTLKNVLKRGYYREFVYTIKHSLCTLAISILLLYFARGAQQYSRLVFGFTFVFYAIITYLVRILWKSRLQKRMKVGGEKRLLIITGSAEAQTVINNLKEKNYGRYLLAGLVILGLDGTGDTIAGVPIVANEENAARFVCQHWIDEVLIVPKERSSYPEKMIQELMRTGVTVHINLAKVINIPGKKQMVEEMADYTVLTTTMNSASPTELLAKRVLDIIGGLTGCILTGIIFLFIAPAIYISSPGPIFFSQERVGKNGKRFRMYKFRSMYMDAEERKAELMEKNKISDAKMFKLDFDPRVIGNKILPDGTKKTGIGQFIRDTSLDEFPQFLSCLTGTMSLVGTRPPLPGEVSFYELDHRSRLAIKPGITGLWQVSGRSDITDFDDVVKLDQEYINNWSLGLDIKILLKTVLVVLRKDGSM